MERVKELIENHHATHPEFAYYIPIIEKAQSNLSKHPDICIETCKSLLEGISKSILEKTPNDYTLADINKLDVGPLVKKAVSELKRYDNVVEDDFLKRCSSLAYAMGALRNARGDISHGRAAPKRDQSDDRLSSLSIKMTAGVIHYMLDAFFSLQIEEEGDEEVVEYKSNPEFNTYLDDETPLAGRVLYSLALYQQYIDDYLIRLGDYEYEQELENEI